MEDINFQKWMPIKVKRKKDNKIILAVFQDRLYNSFMLWDGTHQWIVKPNEDEFFIPTPKEVEIITKNVNSWLDHLYNPTPTKQKFNVTESKVSTVLTSAKNVLNDIKETPKPQPKKLTDFELLTVAVDSL